MLRRRYKSNKIVLYFFYTQENAYSKDKNMCEEVEMICTSYRAVPASAALIDLLFTKLSI